MTTAEAKQAIKDEFIKRFYEWLDDEKNLSDNDFGRKYGWGRGENSSLHKDNLKGVACFQKYFFQGRYIQGWEKVGYDRRAIWQLNHEGFLSYQYYSNSQAKALGRTEFYYISQKTAKEIFKEWKGKVAA